MNRENRKNYAENDINNLNKHTPLNKIENIKEFN
jgi:hypothetical protein